MTGPIEFTFLALGRLWLVRAIEMEVMKATPIHEGMQFSHVLIFF